MQNATIGYHGGELEAWEHEDLWTVKLGELEASSRYLDLALAGSSTGGEERVPAVAERGAVGDGAHEPRGF